LGHRKKVEDLGRIFYLEGRVWAEVSENTGSGLWGGVEVRGNQIEVQNFLQKAARLALSKRI